MSAKPERIVDGAQAGLLSTLAKPELYVGLARNQEDIRAAQRLRYQVFAGEMHAQLHSGMAGLDQDPFDDYCRHLIVRDRRSEQVVACMRILLDTDAQAAGSFYSQTEFDLGGLTREPGRVMEIGRVCVHADYRGGMAVSMLWNGLTRFFQVTEFSRIIGCASIPLVDGGVNAWSAYALLAERHLAPENLRVKPKRSLPPYEGALPPAKIPALLLAYMRLGAKICGEPCWDPDFNTADMVVVLDPADLRQRYARRFLKQGA